MDPFLNVDPQRLQKVMWGCEIGFEVIICNDLIQSIENVMQSFEGSLESTGIGTLRAKCDLLKIKDIIEDIKSDNDEFITQAKKTRSFIYNFYSIVEWPDVVSVILGCDKGEDFKDMVAKYENECDCQVFPRIFRTINVFFAEDAMSMSMSEIEKKIPETGRCEAEDEYGHRINGCVASAVRMAFLVDSVRLFAIANPCDFDSFYRSKFGKMRDSGVFLAGASKILQEMDNSAERTCDLADIIRDKMKRLYNIVVTVYENKTIEDTTGSIKGFIGDMRGPRIKFGAYCALLKEAKRSCEEANNTVKIVQTSRLNDNRVDKMDFLDVRNQISLSVAKLSTTKTVAMTSLAKLHGFDAVRNVDVKAAFAELHQSLKVVISDVYTLKGDLTLSEQKVKRLICGVGGLAVPTAWWEPKFHQFLGLCGKVEEHVRKIDEAAEALLCEFYRVLESEPCFPTKTYSLEEVFKGLIERVVDSENDNKHLCVLSGLIAEADKNSFPGGSPSWKYWNPNKEHWFNDESEFKMLKDLIK